MFVTICLFGLNITNDWITLFATFIDLAATLVLIRSFVLSKKQFELSIAESKKATIAAEKSTQAAEKATQEAEQAAILKKYQKTIEMKRIFINDISPAFDFIVCVLDLASFNRRPTRWPFWELKFSNEEYKSSFGSSLFTDLEHAFTTVDKFRYQAEFKNYLPNQPFVRKDIAQITANDMYTHFINHVNDSLETLEFFASHFEIELADENLIYQSVHERLIKYIIACYPFICSSNNTKYGFVYIHLVALFKIWARKQDHYIKEEEQRAIGEVAGDK